MIEPIQSTGVPGFRFEPLLVIFILLPGLIFTKTFIYFNKKSDTLSKWDKIGFVLGGTVVSSIGLIVLLEFVFDFPPITTEFLSQQSLLGLFFGLAAQTTLAVVFGLISGAARYRLSGDSHRTFNDREDPWEYTVGKIREQQIVVVTDDDEKVEGKVARYRSGNNGTDIVLSPVAPNTEHSLEPDKSSNALYLSSSSVSRIHFVDDEKTHEWEDLLPEGDLSISPDELARLSKKEQQIEAAQDESD